jgi:hypothetical protein
MPKIILVPVIIPDKDVAVYNAKTSIEKKAVVNAALTAVVATPVKEIANGN